MEVNNESNNVDIFEQQLDERQESLQEEKDKLKKQIEKLESIILEMQWNLDLCTFKKTKIIPNSNISDVLMDPNISTVPNINTELQLQLFKFAGFHCLKFTNNEFVFNFSSQNKYDKNNIFAVQILHSNHKWKLGKWVMPMLIDLENIVCQFSNDVTDVPSFLNTCKHYIDCYFIRNKQFNALKETLSHVINCTVQTNDGYTNIILNLMAVHYTNDDAYLNIDIYLEYNLDEIWPCHIAVDTPTHQKLSTEVKKQLKDSLMCFKKCDLHTAFEKMFTNSPFTWSKEDNEDNPLNISDISGSDEEGFLEEFSFKNKRSFRSKKGRKRKIKVKNITESHELNVLERMEEDNASIAFQNEDAMTQNHSQHSIKSKSQLNETSSSHSTSNAASFRIMTPETDVLDINLDEVITSTPMNQNCAKVIVTETSNDISVIANEIHPQNTTLRKINYTDSIEKQKDAHKEQPHKNVPSKMLETKMKKNVKSLIQSKPKSQKKKASFKKSKKT